MNATETKLFSAAKQNSTGYPFDAATALVETSSLLPNTEESDCVRKIERSIAYMIGHLDQPLQVAGLAMQAGISSSHYFALFKRHTGSAPIDYFIRLRMQQARRLLATTAMNVKEVAAALGYDDPFYFSRVFKSVNGIAPSEFRAQNAGEKNGATEQLLPPPTISPWTASAECSEKQFQK